MKNFYGKTSKSTYFSALYRQILVRMQDFKPLVSVLKKRPLILPAALMLVCCRLCFCFESVFPALILCVLCVCVCLIFCVIKRIGKFDLINVSVCYIVSTLVPVLYAVFIGAMYAYKFTEYEAIHLASYERYMNMCT